MEVFREISSNKGIALALGYFDGVHIGHKKIISTLVSRAKELNIKSAVVTFSQNPADYFSNEPTLNIQTFKDRQLLLDSLGVDYLYELDFEQFKDFEAKEYLTDVLVKNFAPKLIVVGYNHTFGKNRSGSPAFLNKYSAEFNYECVIVPELKYKDEKVSSTIIRDKIKYAELDELKPILGRFFSVRNSVIKGKGLARNLGYPTANIVWPESMVKLPYGVYFGHAQIDGKMYRALISWGTKPTLSQGKNETLEAHIYDFSENLYGKIIKVIFVKKIREQKNFGNVLVLKTQLQKDYTAFEKWAKMMS